jgi:hypothetical protein
VSSKITQILAQHRGRTPIPTAGACVPKTGTFKINEQHEILNTGPVYERVHRPARPFLIRSASEIRQVDDGWRIDEPVRFVDDADVVDRNALMLDPTEAPVNVPADHDPRSNSLDRHEQFSAADVLHTT